MHQKLYSMCSTEPLNVTIKIAIAIQAGREFPAGMLTLLDAILKGFIPKTLGNFVSQ
ncbi:hypothetical protein SOV92_13615 [Pectobacterium brasiliense]|uniref:Uncharacterized protein n=1 Tax=Pectobacterium brasiliense TaxID=180957 RepID=A0AAW9H5U4_9GAMM|nr:hypothetical protein [Pectobacterium brasiliense]MDY4378860.1 hypothetical protein [Pectobacterium brasiliense]